MGLRRLVASVQHSQSSPDGALIATLHKSRFTIRSSTTGNTAQSWEVSQDMVSNCKHIKWFHDVCRRNQEPEEQEWAQRILLADETTVRIYDALDHGWQATINGTSSNSGKIVNVAFGHSADTVLVLSDFGVKATLWSLTTKRGIEIKDPKYNVACYGFRPLTGHLALLTRAAGQDVMMILGPGSSEVVNSVELPTIDAQELLWSHNGHWIAIRDVASSGDKVLIYTADGHHFRTFTGSIQENDIGLGIKSIFFSSNGVLIAGDYKGAVSLLANNTFSCLASLPHPTVLTQVDAAVWQEQIDATKQRTYIPASQPANLPTSESFAKMSSPKHGISILACSPDEMLLATKNDSTPSTAWIWSLQTGKPIAILIHHAPIKHLLWHPTINDMLLVQCVIAEPAVHIWRATWDNPKVLVLPLEKANGRLEASWLQSSSEGECRFMITSAHQYITAQISDSGELIPSDPEPDEAARSVGAGVGAEDMFDEGNSLDLSPIKLGDMGISHDYEDANLETGLNDEAIDDTFHYRRHIKTTG